MQAQRHLYTGTLVALLALNSHYVLSSYGTVIDGTKQSCNRLHLLICSDPEPYDPGKEITDNPHGPNPHGPNPHGPDPHDEVHGNQMPHTDNDYDRYYDRK